MNKTELIDEVARRTGLSRAQAAQTVAAALGAMTEALCREEKVQLMGFGTFETRHRPAHRRHNPKTGEPVDISAARAVSFKAGSALRDALKE